MKKLAIIFDSFCGRNKNEIDKKPNMFFIPLQIEIEGKIRKVGISKNEDKEIKKLMSSGILAKTSMPTPADTLEVFKKTSKEYENVIYLPLSSAISGTAKIAMGLAQDFDNILVIETHLVGKAFFEIGKHLIQVANEENANIEKIKNILMEYIKNNISQVYVVPKSIEGMVRSGRISKITSNILERFNVVPVISYEWDNKKLHNKGIKKSGKKAIEFAIFKIETFIANRKNFIFLITATPGREIRDIAEKILYKKKYKYEVEETSPVIHSVCGQNAISISAYKKL